MTDRLPLALTLAALAFAVACGSEGPATEPGANASTAAAPAAGATEVALGATDLEQGIGPVRDMQLDALDEELAATGASAFQMKCSACHKLDERYVGPSLGDVMSRRRPEFVMNMMLNATEMVQRHPEVKELLGQYYTPMPVQVTDQAEARAILEYLRSVQTGSR